jgi:cytochrome c553
MSQNYLAVLACNEEVGVDRVRNLLQGASIALWLAMLSCVAPSLAQTSSDAATMQAARTLATSVCERCHGPEGRSADPGVPIIAGQQQSYIEAQLKAYRAQSRRDPEAHAYMEGIRYYSVDQINTGNVSDSAGLLNDEIMTALSSYFSSQAPAPGKPGDPAATAMGKQIYVNGSTARGIPACAGCHGVNAEGFATVPRLAGQHAQYLVSQMQMLRVPAMHHVVRTLGANEMAAVAAYLQSK